MGLKAGHADANCLMNNTTQTRGKHNNCGGTLANPSPGAYPWRQCWQD
jgi:hypothetical protein